MIMYLYLICIAEDMQATNYIFKEKKWIKKT